MTHINTLVQNIQSGMYDSVAVRTIKGVAKEVQEQDPSFRGWSKLKGADLLTMLKAWGSQMKTDELVERNADSLLDADELVEARRETLQLIAQVVERDHGDETEASTIERDHGDETADFDSILEGAASDREAVAAAVAEAKAERATARKAAAAAKAAAKAAPKLKVSRTIVAAALMTMQIRVALGFATSVFNALRPDKKSVDLKYMRIGFTDLANGYRYEKGYIHEPRRGWSITSTSKLGKAVELADEEFMGDPPSSGSLPEGMAPCVTDEERDLCVEAIAGVLQEMKDKAEAAAAE